MYQPSEERDNVAANRSNVEYAYLFLWAKMWAKEHAWCSCSNQWPSQRRRPPPPSFITFVKVTIYQRQEARACIVINFSLFFDLMLIVYIGNYNLTKPIDNDYCLSFKVNIIFIFTSSILSMHFNLISLSLTVRMIVRSLFDWLMTL